MDENQETVAAEEQELEAGAEDATDEGEGQEAETEGAAEGQQETSEEEAPAQPAVNPYKQRFAAMKGDKVLIARMAKNMMDDLGISYEDAAKYAGITPDDLKARIEKDEDGDNPVMAQANAFDALYLRGGVKESLDEVYGEDTMKFVDAFAQYGLSDEELKEEYLNLEPSKLPAFVVKHGKQLLSDIGEMKGSPAKIIKAKNAEIADLLKQLAEAKAGNSEEESITEDAKPNGRRPLSGAVDSVPGKNTVRPGGSLYDGL